MTNDYWAEAFEGIEREILLMHLGLFEQYRNIIEDFLEGESFQKAREELGIRRQVDPETPIFKEQEDLLDFEEVGYFADVLRRSFFISLYEFLEFKLKEECRYRQRKKDDVLLSVSDISGSGLNRVKIYFTKVLRIDFPANSTEWGKINGGYRQLRNCIIHKGSKVAESEKSLRGFIEREPGLSLHSDSGTVIIHKEFCKEVLDTVEKFVWLLPF